MFFVSSLLSTARGFLSLASIFISIRFPFRSRAFPSNKWIYERKTRKCKRKTRSLLRTRMNANDKMRHERMMLKSTHTIGFGNFFKCEDYFNRRRKKSTFILIFVYPILSEPRSGWIFPLSTYFDYYFRCSNRMQALHLSNLCEEWNKADTVAKLQVNAQQIERMW